MAEIKTDKVWNDLKVTQYTNTDTGVIEIRTPTLFGNKGNLLATGDNKGNWAINDPADFRRNYNNQQNLRGNPSLTKKEFDKKFYTDGANKFNNDRANVLNSESNYKNKKEYESKATAHAENGIPGVKNPTTGNTNNSKGKPTNTINNSGNTVSPSNTGSGQTVNSLTGIEDVASKHPTTNFRYPIGHIPNFGYDFVQFKAFEYDPSPNNTESLTDSGFGNPRETFTLPIIPNIEDTSMTNWGKDEMNFIQGAMGQLSFGTLNNIKTAENFAEAVGKSITEGGEIAKKLFSTPELKDAVVGYFAGQASGTNVLARGQGVVINPNLELLFNGPSLRSFMFNFKLRPRDEDEARECRDMIRAFKKNMNPRRSKGNIFLKTPSVFKIQYFFNGEPHPSMNRIKMCALTNFKVGYTPDSNYMTFQDGQVTGYDISLAFNEIFPIYADDQDTPEARSGVGF